MDRLWSISVEPQQVQKHANTKQMFYWFEQAWACPVGSKYNTAGRTFLLSCYNFLGMMPQTLHSWIWRSCVFSSTGSLFLSQVLWRPSLNSHVQVSPEIFVWVQVRTLAGLCSGPCFPTLLSFLSTLTSHSDPLHHPSIWIKPRNFNLGFNHVTRSLKLFFNGVFLWGFFPPTPGGIPLICASMHPDWESREYYGGSRSFDLMD